MQIVLSKNDFLQFSYKSIDTKFYDQIGQINKIMSEKCKLFLDFFPESDYDNSILVILSNTEAPQDGQHLF